VRRVGERGSPASGIVVPSRVARVADGDDLDARGDERESPGEVERAPSGADRTRAPEEGRLRSWRRRYLQPRDQVAVVLALGEDDAVARLEPEPAGDQVDRLGGVAGPDHLVGAAGVHEAAERLPGGDLVLAELLGEPVVEPLGALDASPAAGGEVGV
jgi:hypothetical protein